ncbi:hypothetical protein vseg_005405 [Gypsophila vaccaria]
MGRAKIAMEFIPKEKARNVTYSKRKNGLLKKAREFAILCNVPVCVILYPYKEGKQSDKPEVYSYKGNNKVDLSRVKDPELAKEIIDKYLTVPKEERIKRSLDLCDMFDEWTRKADQELNKLRHKNAMAKYPSISSLIDNFTPDQLMEVLVHLDQKIGCVNQRIEMIKDGNKSGLVPVIDPSTPVSSFIIHSDNNNNNNNNANQVEYHNQFGGIIDNGEVINQFPTMFNNYPMFSSNVQEGHQMGYFNPDLSYSGKKEQISHGHDTGVVGNNAVLYNYNMNMVYYDQGSSIDDVATMPMSTPLQLPLLPNFSMSGQCHPMFYD